MTPTDVAQTLLDLSKSSEHKAAFLDIRKNQVLTAATESTQRFKDGKVKGMLDGVPVAVKGKPATSAIDTLSIVISSIMRAFTWPLLLLPFTLFRCCLSFRTLLTAYIYIDTNQAKLQTRSTYEATRNV